MTWEGVLWGSRLRAETGNEVEGIVAEEEEWRRVRGPFERRGDGDISCVSLTKPSFIWANPIMCNFPTLSAPLSSTSFCFPFTCYSWNLLTLLGSADECSEMGLGHKDRLIIYPITYAQGQQVLSGTSHVFCLGLCSGGLHLPPSASAFLTVHSSGRDRILSGFPSVTG